MDPLIINNDKSTSHFKLWKLIHIFVYLLNCWYTPQKVNEYLQHIFGILQTFFGHFMTFCIFSTFFAPSNALQHSPQCWLVPPHLTDSPPSPEHILIKLWPLSKIFMHFWCFCTIFHTCTHFGVGLAGLTQNPKPRTHASGRHLPFTSYLHFSRCLCSQPYHATILLCCACTITHTYAFPFLSCSHREPILLFG